MRGGRQTLASAVQVKSGDGAANHDMVLCLIGSVSNTQAQTGLLVGSARPPPRLTRSR